MPESIESDGSLNSECSLILVEEFRNAIYRANKILLAHDGSLGRKNEVIALPVDLVDTWGPEQALEIFAPSKEKALAREVSQKSTKLLESWGLLECCEKEEILERLKDNDKPSIPRPAPLENLIYLWSYLLPTNQYYIRYQFKPLKIVPIADRSEMLSVDRALVIEGKDARVNQEDWSFLISWADIVDPGWLNLLNSAKYKQSRDEHSKAEHAKLVARCRFIYRSQNGSGCGAGRSYFGGGRKNF